MKTSSVKIVIIHDDIVETSPIIVTLRMNYARENVILFRHPQEGLDYVLSNLGQKIVVLLDKNFYDGKEISGIQVFEEIRDKTCLVYIILTSVSRLTDMDEESLKFLINNELFGFENFAEDYSKTIALIDKAIKSIETRVDAVIEEWIMRHPEEKRNQPLVKIKEGHSYSMNEVLQNIRQRTPIGIDFEKGLLKLAIELFSRQKLRIDD